MILLFLIPSFLSLFFFPSLSLLTPLLLKFLFICFAYFSTRLLLIKFLEFFIYYEDHSIVRPMVFSHCIVYLFNMRIAVLAVKKQCSLMQFHWSNCVFIAYGFEVPSKQPLPITRPCNISFISSSRTWMRLRVTFRFLMRSQLIFA